jgi:hypothetical protein
VVQLLSLSSVAFIEYMSAPLALLLSLMIRQINDLVCSFRCSFERSQTEPTNKLQRRPTSHPRKKNTAVAAEEEAGDEDDEDKRVRYGCDFIDVASRERLVQFDIVRCHVNFNNSCGP